jgi:hypothetical protein
MFEEKLRLSSRSMPDSVRDAAVFVNDAMRLCMASARQVFGENATPDLAIMIYDRVVAQMDRQRETRPTYPPEEDE